MNPNEIDTYTYKKSFSSKGVFPYQQAYTLLIPLRNIFLSPKQLIQRIELKEDLHVMELGAGPGYFSIHVAKSLPKGKLILADIQQEMLDYAKRRIDKKGLLNVDYYLCDGKLFRFDNNTLDRIYMVTVLGEVENKELYMQEFHRMLKKGGILSISEQMGDPDKMSIVEVKELAKNNNFTFYNLYGKERNYTINFKK
jgi:ubiquinone/menaquinone biosynthesis C-methylase UbiE